MLPQGAEVATGVAATGAVAEAAPGEHYRCSLFFIVLHFRFIMCLILTVVPKNNYPHPEWIITAIVFYENVFFMSLFRILKIS